MDVDGGGKRVFQRLGAPSGDSRNQKVCYHWRAGKCNRYPCPFLHRELNAPPHAASNGAANAAPKRGHGFASDDSSVSVPRRSPNFSGGSTWGRVHGGGNRVIRKTEKLCNFWVQGNCGYGDKCRYLHSWSLGESFSHLTQLDGHQKVITGIAFPSGSDKLYTGSKDETVRVWDCQSGQCMAVINLGGEVGSMIAEGPWVFVGIPNFVKAWNIQTSADLSLSGPVGLVYALVVGNDLLFAGTQDGSILAWKFNVATNCFDPAASLNGHTLPVVSLVVGANRLYSGSMDHSIKVWSLESLQCLQTLTDHTSVVMSVLCWEQFLLSCSLDKTIKVWAATESGNLEVTYTQKEDHPFGYSGMIPSINMYNSLMWRDGDLFQGLLTLCGMHDSDGKPILLCSCNDNSVRLYDLPSFSERGKIYSKEEIRSIQAGPGGIFFTGDGTGQVKVWTWLAEHAAAAASM